MSSNDNLHKRYERVLQEGLMDRVAARASGLKANVGTRLNNLGSRSGASSTGEARETNPKVAALKAKLKSMTDSVVNDIMKITNIKENEQLIKNNINTAIAKIINNAQEGKLTGGIDDPNAAIANSESDAEGSEADIESGKVRSTGGSRPYTPGQPTGAAAGNNPTAAANNNQNTNSQILNFYGMNPPQTPEQQKQKQDAEREAAAGDEIPGPKTSRPSKPRIKKPQQARVSQQAPVEPSAPEVNLNNPEDTADQEQDVESDGYTEPNAWVDPADMRPSTIDKAKSATMAGLKKGAQLGSQGVKKGAELGVKGIKKGVDLGVRGAKAGAEKVKQGFDNYQQGREAKAEQGRLDQLSNDLGGKTDKLMADRMPKTPTLEPGSKATYKGRDIQIIGKKNDSGKIQVKDASGKKYFVDANRII